MCQSKLTSNVFPSINEIGDFILVKLWQLNTETGYFRVVKLYWYNNQLGMNEMACLRNVCIWTRAEGRISINQICFVMNLIF